MMKDADQCDLAGGFLCFFLGRARKKESKKLFQSPFISLCAQRNEPKKGHPVSVFPDGFPQAAYEKWARRSCLFPIFHICFGSQLNGIIRTSRNLPIPTGSGAANIVSRKRSKTTLLRSDSRPRQERAVGRMNQSIWLSSRVALKRRI